MASVVIPSFVTTIGSEAFNGCSSLATIVIPDAVTSLGYRAFYECNGLTSVTIGNHVTSIGEEAFRNCTGMATVKFGDAVATIGANAFRNCSSLNALSIPATVSSIADGNDLAFAECPALARISVDEANTYYNSNGNCNAILKLNEDKTTNTLIVGCKNTVIPNNVTVIETSAFDHCTGLTDLSIPNSVETIKYGAFYGCTGLTSLEIPSSVTAIYDYAFDNCSNLTSITLCPKSVIQLTGNNDETYAFDNTNDCNIYVPYDLLNAYTTTAAYWNKYESRIRSVVVKSIAGYGESSDNKGWFFIASPLTANTAPTDIENMIGQTYDLYLFNQEDDLEWENYKANTADFNLVNGHGYLYSNKEDVDLVFKGDYNEESSKSVDLAYTDGKSFAGWNLVGNPFPVEAYLDRSYYVMNANGSAIEPVAVSNETPIDACTGVMVKATATGQSVTFSKTAPETSSKRGVIQIALSSSSSRTLLDKAMLSFNKGDALEKFVFNEDNAKLYIPQDGKDFAIATSDKQGEMPLNFTAVKNGTYTLSVDLEGVEVAYLHLMDNMTGANVDLLATPSYSFTATTRDYASRFRLVFDSGFVGEETCNDNFAFVSNGEIVIPDANANATLQIVDMTGRIIFSREGVHTVSTNQMVPGVYVMRLVNGSDVKTQKIVVD
ncbi:MAG: leucine-rich repeat domain-containing protein [Bacteroidales bacterium]|nr:leucine-rich repeat domain-containing protein [Bacteroidales bacterium]